MRYICLANIGVIAFFRESPAQEKNMKKNLLFWIALICLVSGSVCAQEGPWYAAFSGGHSSYTGIGDGLISAPGKGSGTAAGAAFGYRFSPIVAFELGYLDFGGATTAQVTSAN